MKKSWLLLFCVAVVLAGLLLPVCGCGGTSKTNSTRTAPGVEDGVYEPVFTAPDAKLEELSDGDFTRDLYDEALAYEPLLGKAGTQVHMGFWSGKGNHGSLVRVLDAINSGPSEAEPPQKAVWDEGVTTSNQYPSYVRMLEEHWYERGNPTDGKVTIFGKQYSDPKPVTSEQADVVWGRYSQRYSDMAKLFREATGNPVKVWCFVEGAKANRIFYKYELPELRSQEQRGSVQVFFAKTQDADWTRPEDWIEGTANAPEPAPAN